MILVVAPYDGALPESAKFLAGAKKIRAIIQVLQLLDSNVILLNSGHQYSENRSKVNDKVGFDGEILVDVFTPSTRKNPYIGRILNIVDVPFIIADVIATYGMPDIAWLYNGYAFEMRAASCLNKRYGIPTIIEFEDWHFARNRAFNPKPYLDWLCWKLALKNLNAGFAVNTKLRDVLVSFDIPTTLLPGIVSSLVSEIAINSTPFKTDKITVGYFGGLNEEKGAKVLLRLAKKTEDKIHFIITGKGVLQSEFEALQKIMPERFRFLGSVSEADLVIAISQVDVIINAHCVNDGIFPFKVLEALGSGRLLISTKLPMGGYECLCDAIQFYDGNEDNLLSLVNNAAVIYEDKKNYIAMAAEMVIDKYGQSGLLENIRSTISQCFFSKHAKEL